MSDLRGPFRADVVGSFLRPQRLKDARASFTNGQIDKSELTKIEDEEIARLVEKEKEAGLHSFTDGEFRRSWWHLDFFVEMNGVEKVVLPDTFGFQNVPMRNETLKLTGKVSISNHAFVEHFKFIKQFEDADHVAKLTIPSPAQFVTALHIGDYPHRTEEFYPDNDELIRDVAEAYKSFIREVYDAGCKYLQFDEPSWGRLCNKKFRDNRILRNTIADEKILVNNLALEGKPEDMTITAHICRGNYKSSWASEGGYSWIADRLFAKENLDGLFLEYDTERAGGFEPLKYVTPGRKAILGIFTSKFPELEDRKEAIARIREASEYMNPEDIGISPQCGFASTEEGNVLTEQQQWDKVKWIVDIANEVWGTTVF